MTQDQDGWDVEADAHFAPPGLSRLSRGRTALLAPPLRQDNVDVALSRRLSPRPLPTGSGDISKRRSEFGNFCER
jgi:hypothetical protein